MAWYMPVQMMNVEGLTRENVASHLQKFRLQLKRENKLDDEGNLISPLKGVKLGGSEEEAHGSATSQDKDGGGTKGSSPSSREVVSLSVSGPLVATIACPVSKLREVASRPSGTGIEACKRWQIELTW